ncbi:MAG: hypothetical protein GX577_03450 [Leptolinea sp.]|nr:hypothetical protein [Leptolinea sp.]
MRDNLGSIKLVVMGGLFQTYIGIDVQASVKPFFYSAINADLEIIACGHVQLNDVEAYLSGHSSALVAVNGPVCGRSPQQESIQSGLFDEPLTNNRFICTRTGDRELAARGFHCVDFSGKIPVWIKRSLDLSDRLRGLDYSLSGSESSHRAFFETHCDAGYWLSTGAVPYDFRTLEGRLQRQMILCEFGFSVQNPMIFLEEFTRYRLRTSQVPADQILAGYELRALFAAATALLFDLREEAVEVLGERGNGELVLPKDFSRR